MQTALADQIRTVIADPSVQVAPMLVWNPTPPCIDIYPSETFQEQESFGKGNTVIYLDVRARVNTPDHDGAQELLLSLMDPEGDTSVQQAILSDDTLDNIVESVTTSAGPSNYGIFPDPSGQGAFLGCTWTTRVIL